MIFFLQYLPILKSIFSLKMIHFFCNAFYLLHFVPDNLWTLNYTAIIQIFKHLFFTFFRHDNIQTVNNRYIMRNRRKTWKNGTLIQGNFISYILRIKIYCRKPRNFLFFLFFIHRDKMPKRFPRIYILAAIMIILFSKIKTQIW